MPKDSPIKTLADLKGKKVALNKGSNVHYLLVKALEKAGLKYADIQPVFLAPADARAAFEQRRRRRLGDLGPVPRRRRGRYRRAQLVDGTRPVDNHQFYLASRDFAGARSRSVHAIIEELDEADRWAAGNQQEVARLFAPASASRPRCSRWRSSACGYGVAPVTDEVVRAAAGIADVFHDLGLIPKPITVARRRLEGQQREAAGGRERRRPLVHPDPRRRPLPRHHRRRAATSAAATCARSRRPPTSSATSACCCRPAGPARMPGSWRRALVAADRAAALPRRGPARRCRSPRLSAPHGGHPRPPLRRAAADQRGHRRRPGRAEGRRPLPDHDERYAVTREFLTSGARLLARRDGRASTGKHFKCRGRPAVLPAGAAALSAALLRRLVGGRHRGRGRALSTST